MPVIKKYENRRLYDTSASRYVNLDDIARMVEEDAEVVVTDVKTGRDLTREVLLQIVLEREDGLPALPTALLRRIIRSRGDDPQHRLVREQLALGLELLDAQLGQSEAYIDHLYQYATDRPMVVSEAPPPPYRSGPPVQPFGAPHVAAPQRALPPASAEPSPELAPDPAWQADPAGHAELQALRDELAKLEARLKR